MNKSILVVGLNPAWQKILIFKEDVNKGEVNRARDMLTFASGKGANFAKVAMRCGNIAMLAQFVGGGTGDMYSSDLNRAGLILLDQYVKAPTRTCTTLLSSVFEATELIEPSGKISESEGSALFAKIEKHSKLCDAFAVCGTYPPGISVNFYTQIAKLAKESNKPLLLDSYKGITPVLKVGVEILKINRRELAALSEDDNVHRGGMKIIEKYPVKILAVTDGSEKAYLFTDGECSEYPISFVSNVINPIGAGDTVSAVLFSEYLKGTPICKAFRKALDAGSESCRHLRLSD
jgi:1-phosphofructokinase